MTRTGGELLYPLRVGAAIVVLVVLWSYAKWLLMVWSNPVLTLRYAPAAYGGLYLAALLGPLLLYFWLSGR